MFRFLNALTIVFLTPIVLAAPAIAGEHSVVLDVSTMMCGADPHNIKNALSSLAGVSKVEIFLQQKTAVVTFDDQKSTVDQMLSAMAGAGYASLVKSQN